MLTFPKTTTELASIVSQLPVEQQEIEQIWSTLTRVDQGMIENARWSAGIRDLYRTAALDGTFCYTFFKGIAVR